jgi:predicted P-loop ATPase
LNELPKEYAELVEVHNTNKDKNKTELLLTLTDKGAVKQLLSNLENIILFEPIGKSLAFNEFTQEIFWKGELLNDSHINEFRMLADRNYHVKFTKDDTLAVIEMVAKKRNTFHPIKQKIHEKPWDGVQRVETVFIDYLGVDDNSYTKAVTRKWLSGAVARIYEPGIKFEIVPIIAGKQGIGKSTLFQRLGGDFFTDSLRTLGNTKDDYQLLIGTWIIELGELSSMSTTETDQIKSFVSARSDKIRLPYTRTTQTYKRTCVFVGTTNTSQYLNDLTGNRRFLPMPANHEPKKDVFQLNDDVIQQIFAEAYLIYKNGENLFLDDISDIAIADEYREEATERGLFFSEIEEFLDMPVPSGWDNMQLSNKRLYYNSYKEDGTTDDNSNKIDKTSSKEIAQVVFRAEGSDRSSQPQMKKITLFMDNLDGWAKKPVWINKKTVKGYARE